MNWGRRGGGAQVFQRSASACELFTFPPLDYWNWGQELIGEEKAMAGAP